MWQWGTLMSHLTKCLQFLWIWNSLKIEVDLQILLSERKSKVWFISQTRFCNGPFIVFWLSNYTLYTIYTLSFIIDLYGTYDVFVFFHSGGGNIFLLVILESHLDEQKISFEIFYPHPSSRTKFRRSTTSFK